MTSDHVDHVLYNMKEFALLGTMPLSMDGCGTEYERLMDKDYEPKEEEEEEDIEEEDVEADGGELWDDEELFHYRRHWPAEILAAMNCQDTPPRACVAAPSWKHVWQQQNPGVVPPICCSIDRTWELST